ncbi:hypothetical protein CDD82_929 [Ophiocordyceps australis]|uniref:Protein kinase domain-containing protein n=1 Tax=Ophiocordyceps australis TaxID=1399860 RepID=A0A2C5YK53_9HYPO|nr:hypothetical protein CDD82_929 [Ophiocordyceps australis]
MAGESAASGMALAAAPVVLASPCRQPSMALPSTSAPTTIPNPPATAAASDGAAPAAPLHSLPAQACSLTSSCSSSPHHLSSDFSDPNLEQAADDSGSDCPLEPVTPVSGGRYSHDFCLLRHPNERDSLSKPLSLQRHPIATSASTTAPAIATATGPTTTTATATATPTATPTATATATARAGLSRQPPRLDPDPAPQTPLARRSARGSASSFKRTMSSIFRRSTSALERERESAIVDTPSVAAGDATQPTLDGVSCSTPPPPSNSHGNSNGNTGVPLNKSSNTTRSNSPHPLESPLEMVSSHRSAVVPSSLPSPGEFGKKGRTLTGLTLRGRAVNFVGATVGRSRPGRSVRRASSFDERNRGHGLGNQSPDGSGDKTFPPERLPWALPPDAGTGAKARRMSLSLPDDFTIDVVELQSEYEYQHRILGRHGKHLGKGAASRVTLMVRKGCPGELYAVKEFRGKSHRESQTEYEKKIKSEFSIAKSLHHPNIVETMRLCTHHNRWNHVMEYCSEGDLFGLVQKGHLKGDDKKKDRLCLFKQLIQGVAYLHANGIAHRDIKLENLLLTKDSKLKITDFGVSEVFSGTHPGLRESGGQCGRNMGQVRLCAPGICGSEPYIAPEVLAKKSHYDARALDVWGTAIVMIYLTFGGAIWSRAEAGHVHYDKLVQGWAKWDRKHPEQGASITDSDYPSCVALDVGVNPPALRRLLLQMLNPDPSRRIAIDEVLGNRWMRNVECCQVESYDDQALLIDASKKDTCAKIGTKKIFCHNHLPPKATGSHSLGKMPGQPGY